MAAIKVLLGVLYADTVMVNEFGSNVYVVLLVAKHDAGHGQSGKPAQVLASLEASAGLPSTGAASERQGELTTETGLAGGVRAGSDLLLPKSIRSRTTSTAPYRRGHASLHKEKKVPRPQPFCSFEFGQASRQDVSAAVASRGTYGEILSVVAGVV
jgi:hypothetical protein